MDTSLTRHIGELDVFCTVPRETGYLENPVIEPKLIFSLCFTDLEVTVSGDSRRSYDPHRTHDQNKNWSGYL